jgi:tRNA threonylcarbamoyladenosine biosynthesis protein TsaB
VALLYAGAVVASQTLTRGAGFGGHSEHVLELIEAVMRDGGRELAQCDAIAFGAGPGAFTGLRVACAVAQGLAFGLGCPVIPVDCLAAIALASAEGTVDRTSIVLVAQDARIGELYVGIYRVCHGAIEVLDAPFLIGAHDVQSHIGRDDIDAVVGSGATLYPALREIGRYVPGHDHPDARYVGQLAMREFLAKGGIAAKDAAPIYIRDRVALTISERAAGVRLPA